jgi:hypothetical protein
MRFAFRLLGHLLVGLIISGAIIGAVFALNGLGGDHLVWEDDVIDGPMATVVVVGLGALGGIVIALVLALALSVLGLIVPLLIGIVLLAVALAVGAGLASALAALALVCAPVLLLGVGCVLLVRALSRPRLGRPQPLPPI